MNCERTDHSMTEHLTDEQRQLVDYVLSLRSDRIRGLLIAYGIPSSGPKRTLRERLVAELGEETISVEQIAAFLDQVEPWGSQHVYLYDVGDQISGEWADSEAVLLALGERGLADLVAQPLTLTLPDELTLSAIVLHDDLIEIRAVDARRYTERLPELDKEDSVGDLPIEYRAYAQRVSRGLLTLRWDLGNSQAALHISKGHRSYDYEDAEADFADLVSDWLPLKGNFTRLNLHPAIKTLAKKERDRDNPMTRSARVGLQSAGGREIDISSASVHTGAAGEKPIDEAVEAIAKVSRGRLGNHYWLGKGDFSGYGNPLEEELHTMILARDSRIHFMTPSSKEAVAYVLGRVRSLC
jgi:hypothetical protein